MISPGPILKRIVSFLRQKAEPDQRAVLGRRRLCTGEQAAGGREFPVAAERKRGKGDHSTAVPLTHGMEASKAGTVVRDE